jgi:uncharacterized protein
MLESLIARVVGLSIRFPWCVVITALLATVASVYFTAAHFAINTDVARLIDSHDPTAERDRALAAAFPLRDDVTLVVVRAPAQELADAAADRLAGALASDHLHIRSVTQPAGGTFFEREGLLFLPLQDVNTVSRQLTSARPLINALAHDPSLRGLANLLAVTLGTPLETGQITMSQLQPLLRASSDTLDRVLAHQPAAFSYRALLDGSDTAAHAGIALIEVHPVLDYTALAAGAESSEAIRVTARRLNLERDQQASIRLTGATALADEEFSSVAEGALPNAIATLIVVLLILKLALRSWKLVFATAMVLVVGLPVTAALGLLLVGAFNMISVAFAVLFVGIGVDFSLQFGVRYRDARFAKDQLDSALLAAAASIATALTLAALATALSFFAFLPTDYRGVSELGEIAGVGILFVAFPLSLTLMPALIKLLHPGPEPIAPGYPWLAPLDRFFERRRNAVLATTLVVIIGATPLLLKLHFDFNPLHLKDPHSESMATLSALKDSPDTGVDDVSVLSTASEAPTVVARLTALPEVGRVVTLNTFLPTEQDAKIQLITPVRETLEAALTQTPLDPAPDPALRSALSNAARALRNAVLDHPGPEAADAKRLAALMIRVSNAAPAERDAAQHAFADPLVIALGQLKTLLAPDPVTLDSLPPGLLDEWRNAKGQWIIEASPRVAPGQSASDERLLARFAAAVLKVEPSATGGPISILASAAIIQRSFVEAGALALCAIFVLLLITLRRLADVFRTLLPLLVSLGVTLELCVAFGINLNFANIIALPLLLGVGVAFKIYYVLAWREGRRQLLQSSLTQAVLLSAATTATAFGSLWLSHHPGTSSMGQLLALSLFCTLIGAVFFQPILMGRPRSIPSS